MAWWDHEELKSHLDRSLRYKLTFYHEYAKEYMRKVIDEALKLDPHSPVTWEVAKAIGYKPRIRVKAGRS
jgi:hypothetical protein